MRPAYSVIFLTSLIGAAQGLFLALFLADATDSSRLLESESARFAAWGAALSVVLALGGLVASFFHLGRPERAWRSAAKWRTSWLSREVIALPLFIAAVAAWAAARYLGSPWAGLAGAIAVAACLALFVCTAMIYACIKFLQEWASPLTLANFFLIGSASGFTIAAALAAWLAPGLAAYLARGAIALTALAFASRMLSLARNARLKPRSTAQSAIGVRAPRVEQKSMGFMGGSFNTREFFHGVAARRMDHVRRAFILLAFVFPVILIVAGLARGSGTLLVAAALVQCAGVVAERWFFLAQANHPQNLYYQCAS
jgi:DMSO reductase anchor subunit